MKKKNIVFLCYSRYVLFVAYCLKVLLHKNDVCTLIISDVINNENGIIEHIKKLGFWDRVIEFNENGIKIDQIVDNVKQFIESEEIDIFYTANILRCASHSFVHFLKANTEVNMFDEGIISLDLLGGYNFFETKVKRVGNIEFDFSRISKFYVFFPSITKKFGDVQVESINIARLLHQNIERFIEQLNELFDYHYVIKNKKIMFIDSDMASQGSITQEYENHCIDNIMKIVSVNQCIVKLKPSISQKMFEMKYSKYNLKFFNEGNVPFEVVYLNAMINNDLPELIIALPTTAIWNINLINQEMGIKNIDIVSLSAIMYKYFYSPGNGDDMMDKLQKYQTCFNSSYVVRLPKTWNELYEYINNKYDNYCKKEIKMWDTYEYEWLIQEYNRLSLLYMENEIRIRNSVLTKWVSMNIRGIKIEQFFLDKGIDNIILYGYGIFGKLFIEAIDGLKFKIQYIIKSTVTEKEKYINNIPIISVEEYSVQTKDSTIPILITAVGKETEIFHIINTRRIKNKVYRFMDIMKYFEYIS